jgi:hypothetical protein
MCIDIAVEQAGTDKVSVADVKQEVTRLCILCIERLHRDLSVGPRIVNAYQTGEDKPSDGFCIPPKLPHHKHT